MKKVNKVSLVAVLAAGLIVSACAKSAPSKYTYHTWATSLGNNWNPHTWETNADDSLLGYISSPFVDMAPLDTTAESWQWVYEMATEVVDVSASHKADLAKYHVEAPEDDEDLVGYVYDIKLNTNAKWEEKQIDKKVYGGKNITADDYIESFKLLLDPARKNYRANLYYSGESAVAGGNQFYNNDAKGTFNPISFADYDEAVAALEGGLEIYIDVWDFWGAEGYIDEDGNECSQYLSLTDTTVYDCAEGWADEAESDAFTASSIFEYYGPSYFDYMILTTYEENWGYGKTFEETVGLEKVDSSTIRYYLATPLDWNYFMTSLTSTWLVNVDLYKDLSKEGDTGLIESKYGTSLDTTLSYGPYKLVSYQDAKQAKYTQNENWYGWEKKGGALVSTTNFKVNGEYQRQYQTTDIVIDVLDQAAAKLAFERGDLNEYTPTAEEMSGYTLSSQLYQVDETYTMSFFFDTNLEDLKAMDLAETNKNGVVLSNLAFRKAFSLAIDRADWVTNTEGYKPAYSLMNSLYYYDIYNDPTSQYRKTDQAMKAIVDLYGVEYGEGKLYPTLKDAYDSITGYNLNEAKALFKQACDELVAAGLYTAGQEVKFKVAYKKGQLESSDFAQIDALNKYLEAAREGSGFGKITLEALGKLEDRYGDVGERGTYAIGYGAWGGAAFYPFRNLDVYMDPSKYSLHEGRCWDPTTETFTLNVNGTDVTLTYQQWAASLSGAGQYANASNETKLDILSALEKEFLGKYYRIPLAGSCSCFLLGYQQHYFTEKYNIMYDFGGFRLMVYDYNDAQWANYVSSQGGQLNYK